MSRTPPLPTLTTTGTKVSTKISIGIIMLAAVASLIMALYGLLTSLRY